MRVVACVWSLVVLIGSTAQATVIDNFSTDTSTKYNAIGGIAYGLTAGELTPQGSNYTDGYPLLRNDGPVFNVGDTLSLDVRFLNPNYYEWGGLGLSKSVTAKDSYFFLEAQFRHDQPGTTFDFGLNNGGVSNFVSDYDWSTHPVTITLTRTSDTALTYDFQYAKTGGGTRHVSGTYSGLTAGAYYFGPQAYIPTGNIAMDNLSLTSTPEPSALILLGTGLIGLLAYAWRKRR